MDSLFRHLWTGIDCRGQTNRFQIFGRFEFNFIAREELVIFKDFIFEVDYLASRLTGIELGDTGQFHSLDQISTVLDDFGREMRPLFLAIIKCFFRVRFFSLQLNHR